MKGTGWLTALSIPFTETVSGSTRWRGERIQGSFATKEVAVSEGRLRAIDAETEHVIHNEDGTIGERNSYGADPASRPG